MVISEDSGQRMNFKSHQQGYRGMMMDKESRKDKGGKSRHCGQILSWRDPSSLLNYTTSMINLACSNLPACSERGLKKKEIVGRELFGK